MLRPFSLLNLPAYFFRLIKSQKTDCRNFPRKCRNFRQKNQSCHLVRFYFYRRKEIVRINCVLQKMAPASTNRFIHAFPIRSGIGNSTDLHHQITGLIIICCTVIIFSFILLFCSNKFFIFVRLLSCRKVFVLVYVQSEKRKPASVYYRLHRLLQFTRAVISPPRTASRRMVGAGRKSCMA